MKTKICSRCKELKDVSSFSKDRKQSSGLRCECKACASLERRLKYPLIKEKENIRTRKWALDNKDKAKNAHLKRKYGISLDDYNKMLVEQNNKCALCNKEEIKVNKNGTKYDLCVDHCHKTGKIRGLLCDKCNTGLSFLKDDIDFAKMVLNYMIKVTN